MKNELERRYQLQRGQVRFVPQGVIQWTLLTPQQTQIIKEVLRKFGGGGTEQEVQLVARDLVYRYELHQRYRRYSLQ